MNDLEIILKVREALRHKIVSDEISNVEKILGSIENIKEYNIQKNNRNSIRVEIILKDDSIIKFTATDFGSWKGGLTRETIDTSPITGLTIFIDYRHENTSEKFGILNDTI